MLTLPLMWTWRIPPCGFPLLPLLILPPPAACGRIRETLVKQEPRHGSSLCNCCNCYTFRLFFHLRPLLPNPRWYHGHQKRISSTLRARTWTCLFVLITSGDHNRCWLWFMYLFVLCLFDTLRGKLFLLSLFVFCGWSSVPMVVARCVPTKLNWLWFPTN